MFLKLFIFQIKGDGDALPDDTSTIIEDLLKKLLEFLCNIETDNDILKAVINFVKGIIRNILDAQEVLCTELPKIIEYIKDILNNDIVCFLLPESIKGFLQDLVRIMELLVDIKSLTGEDLDRARQTLEDLLEKLKEIIENIVSINEMLQSI